MHDASPQESTYDMCKELLHFIEDPLYVSALESYIEKEDNRFKEIDKIIESKLEEHGKGQEEEAEDLTGPGLRR